MRNWGVGFIAALLMTAGFVGQADAFERHKAYVRGEGGFVFGGDVDPDDDLFEELDYDSGFVVGGGVGYRIHPDWRAEISTHFERRDLDAEDSLLLLDGGDVRVISGLASIYRDFSLNVGPAELKPFVGLGLGVAQVRTNDLVGAFAKGPIADESQTNFAWSVTAGVAHDLTERLALDVRYRFLDAGEYDLDTTQARYRSHAVLAGLRYALGAAPAAPAEVVPAAVQTPAPAPTPETLTRVVYFDFDSDAIRSDAASTLDEVAGLLESYGSYRAISIEAHADKAGRATYNENLSRKRAEAVRTYLVNEKGVDGDRIALSWKGETDPAVDTADGVREARNRRAEVIIRIR